MTDLARRLFDLSGKVALVTGGSRGLGFQIARAFAAQGADLVIASRKLEACVAAADAIESEHGHRALPVACNVSDWSQCDSLHAEPPRAQRLMRRAGGVNLNDGVLYKCAATSSNARG